MSAGNLVNLAQKRMKLKHSITVRTMAGCGRCLRALRRWEEAERILTTALRLAKDVGEDVAVATSVKRELAKVVWEMGRNKEMCEGGTVEDSYFALRRAVSILKGDDLPVTKKLPFAPLKTRADFVSTERNAQHEQEQELLTVSQPSVQKCNVNETGTTTKPITKSEAKSKRSILKKKNDIITRHGKQFLKRGETLTTDEERREIYSAIQIQGWFRQGYQKNNF
mmetsp:Transcript_13811/g.17375  ORF Transcript_13811/g.17375 Transcript_13811/m.17375 type:complete len:224 (+) Transcript_13811:291-962(+)